MSASHSRRWMSRKRRHRSNSSKAWARRSLTKWPQFLQAPNLRPRGEAISMRFVDEFRDRNIARELSAQIALLARSGREYRFMEVCGGHTHTIYKHGIE